MSVIADEPVRRRGVTWRAASDDLIVASFDVPPERPEVALRIDGEGALVSASSLRGRDRDAAG